MSWMNMLSGWQWGVLGAVPLALVALYFLKLRRQPLEVPSTLLWTKSIEDLRANSLWQRLRQSLLLLLQLLLVALLMLALLRPHTMGTKLAGGRTIFLVDNSASMSATDVKPTRLDEAKRRVGELIDAMGSDDVAMVISFSDVAEVAQSFTNNRRELRRGLASIAPTSRRTALAEALTAAGGLANSGQAADDDAKGPAPLSAKLYIFSDGKFSDVSDFSLGNLDPVYVPIGDAKPRNLGIVAFSASRHEDQPEMLQIFTRVANFGPEKATCELTLLMDGQLVDADTLEIEPDGESNGTAFDLNDVQAGVLELQVKATGDKANDQLAVDDRAWITVNEPRLAQVLLVTSGNEPLEKALRTSRAKALAKVRTEAPGFLDLPEYAKQAASGQYDLVIFDRCRPKEMPRADTLLIGTVPPGGAWEAKPAAEAPQIIDTETTHPLMRGVDLGDVLVATARPLVPPSGGTVLVESVPGPLVAVAPREEFQDAVVAFDLFDDEGFATNWPLRASFPVFVLNVLDYFGGHNDALSSGSVEPGETVTLAIETPKDVIRVTPPEGKAIDVPRGSGDTFHFSATNRLGVYETAADGVPAGRFAVSLLNAPESDIRPRPEQEIRVGAVEIVGESGWEVSRRELWKPLVLLVLAILLLEWYIYNRRVYV